MLVFSSLTQHEAPPGQHHRLQDDTVHRAQLPEPFQSTSSANEPLLTRQSREWQNPAQHPLPHSEKNRWTQERGMVKPVNNRQAKHA